MAAHSSILAWRIPWTEEPDGLQTIGSQSRTRLKQLSMPACIFCMYLIYYFISNIGKYGSVFLRLMRLSLGVILINA